MFPAVLYRVKVRNILYHVL